MKDNALAALPRLRSVAVWLLLAAGLVLSFLSGLKACMGPCVEAQAYRVLGIDLGWLGVGWFASLMALHALRQRFPPAGGALLLLVLASLGAEVHLIWLQKFVIGQWCPLCLGIAAVVLLTVVVLVHHYLTVPPFSGGSMKSRVIRIVVGIFFVCAGFMAAVMGITREAAAEGLDIYMGKTDSPTTVYFVSDWFCPSCRKVEPLIEQMYPEVAKVARVAFVDMPIHQETVNYTPYHLQFMLYEKEKYIALRSALDKLSRKTKAPTAEEVQAAVSPFGVKVRPLDLMEFQKGVLLFQSITKAFGVSATPTVVVHNQKTKKAMRLVGDRPITRQKVMDAITAVEK